MKMTKVRLIGLETFDLPIQGAKLSDPYICKAIDGLGPSGVDVFISDNVWQGGTYQGRRPQNREIVARVGLNPNYILGESPGDLRQALYGLLEPGNNDSRVDVQLMDGLDVVAETYGYVKKFETVLFTKEPEVQITIGSPEPYLSAPDPISVPIPNDSAIVINNEGTAPTGFEISMTVTTEITTNIRILLGDKELRLTPVLLDGISVFPDGDFNPGDIITINTNLGERSVKLVRSAVEYDGLYIFTGDWLSLRGGANAIDVIPDASLTVDSFSYTPKYWGI